MCVRMSPSLTIPHRSPEVPSTMKLHSRSSRGSPFTSLKKSPGPYSPSLFLQSVFGFHVRAHTKWQRGMPKPVRCRPTKHIPHLTSKLHLHVHEMAWEIQRTGPARRSCTNRPLVDPRSAAASASAPADLPVRTEFARFLGRFLNVLVPLRHASAQSPLAPCCVPPIVPPCRLFRPTAINPDPRCRQLSTEVNSRGPPHFPAIRGGMIAHALDQAGLLSCRLILAGIFLSAVSATHPPLRRQNGSPKVQIPTIEASPTGYSPWSKVTHLSDKELVSDSR